MASIHLKTAGIAAALALGLSAQAAQAQSVQVGILKCDVSAGIGLIVGSQKTVACVFDRAGGRDETYTGTITRLGLDVGVTGEAHMVWAVVAPSNSIAKGALAGNYVGASANASAGLGLGANALLGGSNQSVGLQPISVQGQTGVNVALGVAGLTLQAGR